MSTLAKSKFLLPLPFLLPLVIILEGFISISVEILTIRQLLPVAGGSVIVTSLIIGIFLLFLAWGYQYGGKFRSHPHKNLSNNFMLAAVWLGIGLSYLFISFFFYAVESATGPHILYPLIGFLLLIIAPLIFLLGQTVPITMNMMKPHHSAGKIGGNTLGLSTIGSFLGAIMTTLVLMYFFGVAWTLFIDFLLLAVLSILLAPNNFALMVKLVIAIFMTWVIYSLNVRVEEKFFILTNNYANYQILNSANSKLQSDEKVLIINDTFSSFINSKNKAYPYVETIKKILFNDLKMSNADILVLGAGGFTISAEGTHSNRFTYVDIDPQIKKVTVPHFIKQLNSKIIYDDARHFLKTTSTRYQAIIIDTYSDIKTIPAHLMTSEYMQQIKQRLDKNGVAIFNIIANPFMTDYYSKRADNTIRTVFKNCSVLPNVYANQVTNIIYACSNTNTQEDKKIYSDNLNNSTTDSFNW